MLADAQYVDPIAAVCQDVAHALFGRHHLALLIDDDACRASCARLTLPSVGFDFAGQQFQQCGLACAVRSDHADAVAARDAKAEIAS
jgi:hypothetical protein